MKKKHVIIIGGTKGGGRVLANQMSISNNHISIIGRVMDGSYDSNRISFFELDLSLIDKIPLVIENIIEKNGRISSLIFYQRYRGKDNNWQGEFEISLNATRILIDSCIGHFDEGNERSIVVISSNASHLIHDEQPIGYHVFKSALIQLVRFYAVKLGPMGIRVNAISPGIFLKPESLDFYNNNTSLREVYEQITPLKRMGKAEDIANFVEFLCSDKASFITGQEIIIDGGTSLKSQSSIARIFKKEIFD